MKIYYYRLSSGEYAEYDEITLCHTEKYTPLEFLEMQQNVLTAGDFTLIDEVAKLLCDKYGFTAIEPIAWITTEDVYHRKTDNIKKDEDGILFELLY